ncbi:polyprenyl synthetase family protein [Fodinicola feengrottensis]|uniref:Polyprenyl synthetase family protein n=1 Tax=Fodinicola feengrottensis TaxID=435914 RepID=A0ABN2FNW2_9ACTN
MVRRPTSLTEIVLSDPELEASIKTGLDAVEERLREAVRAADPLVNEAAAHLLDAGGKRFRPLLVLAAAQFGDPELPAVLESAVVVELTHLATLYHDDVMDEADVRRGAPSANARWSNSVAILTGDYLFARASDVVADLGPEAVRIQSRTFSRLVTGQIRETAGPLPGVDPVEHYLGVLADKTGSLIATSGRFGAMFSGASAEVVKTLTTYGETIGVAFQVSDDLLDIDADPDESGKTPGTDLREGVPTLPVLYALQSSDPAEARLRSLISRPLTEDDEVAEAIELLRKSPAMDAARQTLRTYADRSLSLVSSLPEGPAKTTLQSLAEVVVGRTG